MIRGAFIDREKVDGLRAVRGLTWAQLCYRSEVSMVTRAKIRRDGGPLAMRTIQKLAKVLGVPLKTIMLAPVGKNQECGELAALLDVCKAAKKRAG